jgi:hypothetical protein
MLSGAVISGLLLSMASANARDTTTDPPPQPPIDAAYTLHIRIRRSCAHCIPDQTVPRFIDSHF